MGHIGQLWNDYMEIRLGECGPVIPSNLHSGLVGATEVLTIGQSWMR